MTNGVLDSFYAPLDDASCQFCGEKLDELLQSASSVTDIDIFGNPGKSIRTCAIVHPQKSTSPGQAQGIS